MSIKILTLDKDNTQAWDSFVSENNASLYHLSQWKNLIEEVFGHETHYLYAINNSNKILAILPIVQLKSFLFGNYLVSIPFFNYGGIFSVDDEATDKLFQHAEELRRKLGCSHIEYRHQENISDNLPVRTDKVTMLLDLPEDPGTLWKAIGSKRRAQVKRPIREGVEFKTGEKELINDFYTVFSENMRDLGTPVYSKKLFQAIFDKFPDKASIAIVYLNDAPVGAAFLLSHNGQQEIPWASTLRRYNRLGINMYMYWNILESAIKNGFKRFDFGRSGQDAGTLKFKKQWGAEEHQLYWHYSLEEGENIPVMNHSNKKFELAINLWKKLPLSFTNRLGPLVVKNLP
ncbi:FemAB family XrtA/PEP-CTERM system-associated protein [Pleionea sediminis]|uniref:FemAB family XrtA/PEP-CTERM system-associated protein n=1 Tax=Pleionea sediminis TaxID=2569479 RepID=UPI001185E783|nr:FemAB family XrtA/PEP-CTERM system-associated protein [Pleionea sediminis]